MELNNEQKMALQAIQGLNKYVVFLSETKIPASTDESTQIKTFAEWMAVYYGIEKYQEISASDYNGDEQSPRFGEEHRRAIRHGLSLYAGEMKRDDDIGLDTDIKLCEKIISEMNNWEQSDKIISAALTGLTTYAKCLAAANLEVNRERIEDIWDLTEQITTYFEIGLSEREQYLNTIKQLLDGDVKEPLLSITSIHMSTICNGIDYYQNEIIGEFDEEYYRNIRKQCKTIIQNFINDTDNNSQEWTEIQM